MPHLRPLAVAAALVLTAGGLSAAALADDAQRPYDGAVARAVCGPGSLPEPALQGQVPKTDRDSGRSTLGYRCNLELLGQHQGAGASWVAPSYATCAYVPQAVP